MKRVILVAALATVFAGTSFVPASARTGETGAATPSEAGRAAGNGAGSNGSEGKGTGTNDSGTSGGADSAEAETLTLDGLEKPGSISIDKWGIPHIYAETLYDAFFLQGFNAARDRLFQIDLWRKRGLGEMAKDFGPDYVDGDRMARAVLFRGDMYREWLSYGSDSKRVAQAFTDGINQFVKMTQSNPDLLPQEFKKLGYKPSEWKPEDVVRIRHHGLTLNATNEVDRAAVFCKVKDNPVKADWLRRELSPTVDPKLVEDLDPCAIPVKEIKDAYNLATATPKFAKLPPAGEDKEPSGTKPAKKSEKISASIDAASLHNNADSASATRTSISQLYNVVENDSDVGRGLGSNNWVIDGKRTTTGRPILANDPHRSHGAPSLRYISQLTAPGLSVIGAGEPFLPGISIGHNDKIGFGLTRFYMDQEDMYQYEINPDNKDEYKYKGRWEPMETVEEKIEVKGGPAQKVTLRFTRHGPVLYQDDSTHKAWALRAAWLDLGMAPYYGSMDYMRATNWDEFKAAMNRWGAPGENQVFADSSGNIAWMPGGLTVKRDWDGLTPVPGDGRYEWKGYRDMDELPSLYNPEAGYIVTANENNIPPDHPAFKKGIGYEWSSDFRAKRLKEIIGAKDKSSIADSEGWQNDKVSLPAVRTVAVLKNVSTDDAKLKPVVEMLQNWDGEVLADSPEAAIFEVWFSRYLRKAVVDRAFDPDIAKVIGLADPERVLDVIEKPQDWFSDEDRDKLMLDSLKDAVAEVSDKLGDDPKTWKWGTLHQAVFLHPMNAVLSDEEKKSYNVDAGPIGGSGFTPMATSYGEKSYNLTSGASFRMVLDVGQWDDSRVINTPGQSGDSRQPGYRDLAPLWAKGEYIPLSFTKEKVKENTVKVLKFEPGTSKDAQ